VLLNFHRRSSDAETTAPFSSTNCPSNESRRNNYDRIDFGTPSWTISRYFLLRSKRFHVDLAMQYQSERLMRMTIMFLVLLAPQRPFARMVHFTWPKQRLEIAAEYTSFCKLGYGE